MNPYSLAQFRMVEHGFQPVDPWEDRVKWTDNQIDVFSKTFQGLTVSCARCHDHKFDAISQRDYYALFGIFANARPTQVATDEAAVLNRNRAELTGAKPAIKSAVAKAWETAAEKAAAKLLPDNPWFTLRNESFRSDLQAASSLIPTNSPPAATSIPRTSPPVYLLGTRLGHARHQHLVYPLRCWRDWHRARRRSGTHRRPAAWRLYTSAHSQAQRHYHVASIQYRYDYISMKVAGANGAAVRLIVENYAVPRGGIYNQITPVNDSKPHWIRWNTNFWKGFTAYIEFATADLLTVPPGKEAKEGRSWIGVQQVLFHDKELTPKDDLPAVAALLAGDPPATAERFQARLATTIREAIQAWSDNRTTDTQAALLDYLTRQNLLPVSLDALPDVRPLVDRYRKLEQEIPLPRRAPGILEEGGEDQSILIRGNISRPCPPVPRRYLEALDSQPYQDRRSMRLQLANEVASPGNPLTARVMPTASNTLFRRGIVRTVDNFGKLGDKPSHPELLDYLAARFVADGWSIKKLTACSPSRRLTGSPAAIPNPNRSGSTCPTPPRS